jgi:hypothetical protein
MSKKRADRLSRDEKIAVEDVVRACRGSKADDMSPTMRLIADEQAQEILSEDYGIAVSLTRLRRVA